jgi:tetratricopeptide (TPR) repeat protein
MLKPKKKLAKKELKRDALLTTYGEATAFYEKNRKIIHIVAGSLVVLVLAVVVYTKNRAADEEKASAELGKVLTYFDRGQYGLAIDGVTESNIQGLKSIAESYSGTRSGELAAFYLASAYYEQGNYQEALQYFEDFDPPGDMLVAARLSGIAACQEALGHYGEAAAEYETAANAGKEDISSAEYLFHAARNYSLAGEKEKAKGLLTRLKKEFPTSPYGRDADRYIAELSV